MAAVGRSTFTVTDRTAPRREVDPAVRRAAEFVAVVARAHTPTRTGLLAAGWQVNKQRPSNYLVSNAVSYVKYVEFGTRKMTARPMLAPALLQARQIYG